MEFDTLYLAKRTTLPPSPCKKNGQEEEDMDFEIVRDLGSGAYGKVFSIKCGSEYRALKVQEFYDVKDGAMITGSVREHVFFKQFPAHPNILKYKSFWRVKQNLFFTLPLYSCDLFTLSKQSPISYQDFLLITRSLCNGLKAMHDAHWMHRDFKMENVLVDAKLGVCISDFNLVRFCGIDVLPFSQGKVQPAKNSVVSSLSSNATTEVCSLWTRPPEVVLDLLAGKKHTSYGLEFDMFSLGATLMGMLGGGGYVAGNRLKGRGTSSEEKYVTACLDLTGIDVETMALYHPYSQDSPTKEKSLERVKHCIIQAWSSQQRESAAQLLLGLLHPNPKLRFTWKDVEKWFIGKEIPTTFSYTVLQTLLIQATKTRTTKNVTLDFDIVEDSEKRKRIGKSVLNSDVFWSLCGNCNVPPFISIEVLRLKFSNAYNMQESQSLLFILECLHGYVTSHMSSQISYISPEDVWDVLKDLPAFDASTINLAASLRSYPFKLCCLATEVALTGKCESPEKLEDTKLLHLSTAGPFFGPYGTQWKSQKDLRTTWLRLLTLGLLGA
jgi:serine/threonine protein kinase